MKKRESIIILLAALAAVYGLLDYFVLGKKDAGSEEQIIQAAVEDAKTAGKTSDAAIAALTAANKGRVLSYSKKKAEGPWLKDPFIQHTEDPEALKNSGNEALPDMIYSGFIQLGSNILGIINGMEYSVGDLVLEIGFKVVQITPLKVTLLTQTEQEVTLYLQED